MCLNKKSRRKFLADALFWTALPTVGVVALAHVSPAAATMPLKCPNGHWLGLTGCLAGSQCEFGNFLNKPDDVGATGDRESPRLPSIKTARLHKANKGTHRKPLARPAQGGRG